METSVSPDHITSPAVLSIKGKKSCSFATKRSKLPTGPCFSLMSGPSHKTGGRSFELQFLFQSCPCVCRNMKQPFDQIRIDQYCNYCCSPVKKRYHALNVFLWTIEYQCATGQTDTPPCSAAENVWCTPLSELIYPWTQTERKAFHSTTQWNWKADISFVFFCPPKVLILIKVKVTKHLWEGWVVG